MSNDGGGIDDWFDAAYWSNICTTCNVEGARETAPNRLSAGDAGYEGPTSDADAECCAKYGANLGNDKTQVSGRVSCVCSL